MNFETLAEKERTFGRETGTEKTCVSVRAGLRMSALCMWKVR
jgi:hypothetical protein